MSTDKDSSLLGIISGKDSVKVEVGISQESIGLLCLGLLVVIILGSLIHKKIQE